tara:strand:- start:31 stop:3084 length:3054 start_codon:yes stop_codon:yes gene_type:complete
MATTIVSNSTAATAANSPQKTGEPLDHATLYSGKALEFDGVGDWLEFPTWNIPESNSFTLAAWVYRHSNPSSNYKSSILNNNDYAHLGFFTSGKVYWRVRDNADPGAWALDNNDNSDTSQVVPLNKWTRIVAVHNYGTDQRIYIDGKLDSIYKSYTGTFQSGSTYGKYRFIGKAGNNSFDGKICDVQIWEGTAWAEADVEYDYKNPEALVSSRPGTSVSTSHLKRWFPMNEGQESVTENPVIMSGLYNWSTSSEITSNFNNSDIETFSNASPTGFTAVNTNAAIGNADNAYADGITAYGGDVFKITGTFTGIANGLIVGLNISTHGASTDLIRDDNAGTTITNTSDSLYTTNFTYYGTASTSGSDLYYPTFRLANNGVYNFTISNVSVTVYRRYTASSTFLGSEEISSQHNREFTNGETIDWQDSAYTDTQFAEDGGTYDEAATSGATEGDYFTDNYLKLVATSDASHDRYAVLDGAAFETNMVSGRAYRLSYSMEITSFTSGRLEVGFGSDSGSAYSEDNNQVNAYTSTQSAGTYTKDFVYKGTSSHAKLMIKAEESSAFTAYFDNFSIKEIGHAHAWTAADQQDTIPQSALINGSSKMRFKGDYGTEGKTYIDTGANPLSNKSVFSCGIWINPDSDRFTKNIIGTSTGWTGDGWHLGQSISEKLSFRVTETSGNANSFEPVAVDNSGKWIFVVVTYDGTTQGIYHYGYYHHEYEEEDVTCNLDYSGNLYIGTSGSAGTNTSVYSGFMDEISYWDKVLSRTEVRELWNEGTPLDATKHSASSDLVGYWRNNVLTSEGKWEDLSSNNNHGTIYNASKTYVFFQEGTTANLDTQGFPINVVHPSNGALHLKENDYVDFGRNIDIEGDFTVQFWRKLTDKFTSVTTDGVIIGSTADPDTVRYPYNDTSGKNTRIYSRPYGDSENDLDLDSGDQKSNYEWCMVTFIRESGTYKAYINNTFATDSDTNNTGDARLRLRYLGKDTAGTGKGFIDEFRVYDRALTASEVSKNYNHGKSKHKNN